MLFSILVVVPLVIYTYRTKSPSYCHFSIRRHPNDDFIGHGSVTEIIEHPHSGVMAGFHGECGRGLRSKWKLIHIVGLDISRVETHADICNKYLEGEYGSVYYNIPTGKLNIFLNGKLNTSL